MFIPIELYGVISDYIDDPCTAIKLSHVDSYIFQNAQYLILHNEYKLNTIEHINIISKFKFEVIDDNTIINKKRFREKYKNTKMNVSINAFEELDINTQYFKVECVINFGFYFDLKNYNITHMFIKYLSIHAIIFPLKLKILELSCAPDADLRFLQNLTNLIELDMTKSSFNQQINLPPNLKKFMMPHSFNKPINFPPPLTHLYMGTNFDQQINLPNNLILLSMGLAFNKPLILSPNLESLHVGANYGHTLILPKNLTNIKMRLNHNNIRFINCQKLTSIHFYYFRVICADDIIFYKLNEEELEIMRKATITYDEKFIDKYKVCKINEFYYVTKIK